MPNHETPIEHQPKSIDHNAHETARIKAHTQTQIKLDEAAKKLKEAEENLKTQEIFEIEGSRRSGGGDKVLSDPRFWIIFGPALFVYSSIAFAIPAVIAGAITGLVTKKPGQANRAFNATFWGLAGTTLAAGAISTLPTGPQYETRDQRIFRLSENIRISAQQRNSYSLAGNWRSLEKMGVDPLAGGQVGKEIHAATIKSCEQEKDEIDDKYDDYYSRVDAAEPCNKIMRFFYDEVLKREAQAVAAAAAAAEENANKASDVNSTHKPKLV